MKSGAPGRAPGRPALPSSQTGRRLAVRRACSPVARPASGTPVRGDGRCRPGADGADERCAGDAGARRWGRPASPDAPPQAGEPAAERERDRALPRPASRTRVPFPRHHASARGASAWSVGGSSARGTCVRKARVAVGRNGGRGRHRSGPIRLCSAETPRSNCNASCSGARTRQEPAPVGPATPVVRATTSRRRVFTSEARAGLESRRTSPHGPGRSVHHERPTRRPGDARGHRLHARGGPRARTGPPPAPASRRRRRRRPATRHRPPRRQRLSARAHARVLQAGDRAAAPTTSSRTSSRPRTACSSPATSREIGSTTDVAAPKFPDRKTHHATWTAPTSRTGSSPTSRSRSSRRCAREQPMAQRPQEFNGRFEIPTFDEVLAARQAGGPRAAAARRRLPRDEAPDLPPAARAPARAPRRRRAPPGTGSTTSASPVIIQSFEQSNLRYLNRITPVTLEPARRRLGREPRRQPAVRGDLRSGPTTGRCPAIPS